MVEEHIITRSHVCCSHRNSHRKIQHGRSSSHTDCTHSSVSEFILRHTLSQYICIHRATLLCLLLHYQTSLKPLLKLFYRVILFAIGETIMPSTWYMHRTKVSKPRRGFQVDPRINITNVRTTIVATTVRIG